MNVERAGNGIVRKVNSKFVWAAGVGVICHAQDSELFGGYIKASAT